MHAVVLPHRNADEHKTVRDEGRSNVEFPFVILLSGCLFLIHHLAALPSLYASSVFSIFLNSTSKLFNKIEFTNNESVFFDRPEPIY